MAQLGNHQKQLQADHATLAANLDITGEPEEISDLIQGKQDEINTRETEWETEKAELLAQAEALKAECGNLQNQVKEMKEKKAAEAAAAE